MKGRLIISTEPTEQKLVESLNSFICNRNNKKQLKFIRIPGPVSYSTEHKVHLSKKHLNISWVL